MNTVRKKVLFVITKSNWGGAGRYVYDLATALPRQDYEVAVAHGTNGLSEGTPGALQEKLKKAGIRTLFLPSLGRDVHVGRDIKSARALFALFSKEKPDIVHLNSSKIGALGALVARLTRVPRIVFTAHGWPFFESRSLLSKSIIFCISYLTLLLSHVTISVSRRDHHAFSFLPFGKKKHVYIPNGITMPQFLDRDSAREKLSLPKGAYVLGTIAELHKNKNLDAAIAGVALYNQTHEDTITYLIVGEGEERNALEKSVRDQKSEAYVRLPGFVEDASTLLPACDAFILPSYKEGLPYVILEAGAAGLPVIATATGGIPDIICDGESGVLLASPSAKTIAEKLDEIRKHTNIARARGESLQQRVSNIFTLEKMVSETVRIYEA